MTKRAWVECRQCGHIAYYDYLVHSLSNPVKTLPCGHGSAIRWDEAVRYLTPTEVVGVTVALELIEAYESQE